MIWLVIFLCIMFYGLGYMTNYIITNLKYLDDMVKRYKDEEQELANKFKQGVQQIAVDLATKKSDNNLNKLKNSVKKQGH